LTRFLRKNHQLNPLKWIVLISVGLSLFCTLFDSLFPHLNIPRPTVFFSLSLWGVQHLFLWQLLTHFFVSPFTGGLDLSFVLYLVFNLYFLWVVGSSVILHKSTKDFLSLYLGGGLLGGLVSLALLWINPSPTLIAGFNPAFYALLTAWMMLFPEVQVLLFFTIPVKIKWLILGILGVNLFIDISHGDFLHCAPYVSSALLGYFYALLVWHQQSPFTKLHIFEKKLLYFSRKLQRNSSPYHSGHSKIYDFKTGNPILSDEEFFEVCLTKIASHGKNSLSLTERWKMRRISKKKKRHENSSNLKT